jgi:hypothetical protein
MMPPMMTANVNPLLSTRLGWYCVSLVLNQEFLYSEL